MLTAPLGAPRPNLRRPQRRLVALLAILSATAVACGGGAAAEQQVASLGTSPTGSATQSSVDPANTQDAMLAYAACMRENGINMADPTFDADGNPQGGLGFGPESGIDPQSAEFQAAQTACGSLIAGITLGGPRGGLDRAALQAASADFTACLRDEGLVVDDLTLGQPGGGGGGGGGGNGPANGGAPTDGSVPGGFQGGPPAGGGGANGQGFDPTARLIARLGLDATDPAVAAAITKCQPILEAAIQPAGSTTTTP